MSEDETLSLLQEWETTVQELEHAWDGLAALTRLEPDSILGKAIWGIVEKYTAGTAARVGDDTGLLDWHLHENQLGTRGMACILPGGAEVSVQTVEDLLRVLQADAAAA